jgi:hypothetical protein
MHAVVARATVHDYEAGKRHLTDEVVPVVSNAPGFVAAYWVQLASGSPSGPGAAMLVFESEEAARAVAEQITTPGEIAVIESIEVGEVAAHA